MSALRLPLLALLGVLVLAGPAQAASSTGYAANGRHRFVTLEQHAGHPVLQVTALTRARYRRHVIAWECHKLSTGSPMPLFGDASGGGAAWLGDPHTRLEVLRGADYCQVQIALRHVRHVHHRGWTETITRVDKRRQTLAVTEQGRAYVARVRGAFRLYLSVFTITIGYDRKHDRFLTPAELFAKHPKLADAGYVPLSGPESTPPKGKHGVWTDGAKRFRATEVTRDGQVLYYDSDAATKILTTNAQDEIDESTRSGSWWNDGGYWTSSSSSRASRR